MDPDTVAGVEPGIHLLMLTIAGFDVCRMHNRQSLCYSSIRVQMGQWKAIIVARYHASH